MNFFPAILNFRGRLYYNMTELDTEIVKLQKERKEPDLLSGLISYRNDILEFAQNIETNELIKNILKEWHNYETATKYNDAGYMKCFHRSIAFFTFLLHVKLSQKTINI